MADVLRHRVVWSGSTVTGGGVSTFYQDSPDTAGPGVLFDFFNAFAGILPTGTTITVATSGDIIETSNGELIGAWSGGTGGVVTGTNTTGYARGVGMRVRWNTAGIFHGRRVRGSTFLCPLGLGVYDTDGSINSSVITASNTAISDFVGEDQGFGIWSRPQGTATDGEFNLITSGTLPDAVSWLRSRRT